MLGTYHLGLSVSELAKLPAIEVEAVDRGTKHRYTGILVWDILNQFRAQLGDALPDSVPSIVVRVTGLDNYSVDFALTEFDPAFSDRSIVLAERQDGSPLPENALPFRFLSGVTEEHGSYNQHSATEAAGGALALPLLEKAARDLVLDPDDRPVVVADYGSSQGKNSLAPIRAAIAILRKRTSARRPICVVHVDLAENDFSTLFGVLHSSADSYLSQDQDVFPSAVGRSFYRPVLPPGHVHLGRSSYAAVWLSRAPTMVPGHFWIPSSTGAVRAAFGLQAAEDWKTFLKLRARELRAGGRLVVVLPSAPDEGKLQIHAGMNHINAVLAEMVAEGAIAAEERERMLLLSYPRSTSELLAPFARAGRFENLVVEQREIFKVQDPGWMDYERDQDREKLAAKHTGFFRATFMPSLASALASDRGAEGRQFFIDRLADGLKKRLVAEPMPLDLLAQAILLAKEAHK